MQWQQAIERCTNLLHVVYNSEIEKIKANIEIGSIVADILENAKYGDRAVEKFALELTKKRGKTVYAQRLYEAYEVWSTVKTIDKVLEIQKKLDNEITWNWLVKNASRGFFNESNEKIKKEKVQKILRQIEKTSDTIEQIVREKDQLDEDTKKEFEGAIIALKESVFLALKENNKDSNITENIKHADKAPIIHDESGKMTKILLEYIKYDELTLNECSYLEVHSLCDNGDIDSAIVVSRETHHKIHEGIYSQSEIQTTINKRNLNLAKLFLHYYLSHKKEFSEVAF